MAVGYWLFVVSSNALRGPMPHANAHAPCPMPQSINLPLPNLPIDRSLPPSTKM
ncbi:hypothetical protein QUB57_33880 [Microcoleus sp. F6_C1]